MDPIKSWGPLLTPIWDCELTILKVKARERQIPVILGCLKS